MSGSGASWVALGALAAALGVAAGAFGAHGLASRLDPRSLELWETACRYWMYGAFSLLAIGLWSRAGAGSADLAAWTISGGMLVFSGTVAALALGAPKWLGAVTPIGGLGLIAGLLIFGWTSLGG